MLTEGAPFHVVTTKSAATTPESPTTELGDLADFVPQLFTCSLTSDHRCLLFHTHDDDVKIDGSQVPDPIEIGKILEFQTVLDDKKQVDSVQLRVKPNSFDECVIIKLESPPEPSRKPSVSWLAALCKV